MQHGLQSWPGWQLQGNNHPIQDTAHSLSLKPLHTSQNQNLKSVPNLKTHNQCAVVERVPTPEQHGLLHCISKNSCLHLKVWTLDDANADQIFLIFLSQDNEE